VAAPKPDVGDELVIAHWITVSGFFYSAVFFTMTGAMT
jgi:hypothetical protein